MLLLALLSGCVPTDASPQPEPTPTFVAPYASDEEALAAAEEAYAEYVRVTGAVYGESLGDPADLSTVATGDHLDELVDALSRLEADEQYIVGEQTFDQVILQRYSRDESNSEVLAVYLCDDLSGLAIYSGGEKVGPEKPITPAQMQVVFDYSPESKSLLVSARDIWSSESC
ncbi:hypothetical protein ADILRU_1953 [Leifsonia rubra CMS 76R]|nr:hypothetical protein ADILRU_1953 [Leifsonia rubra CMS 76R]